MGSISKDSMVHNIKKTGLNEYDYNFSVGYETIDISDVKDT